MKWMEFIKVQTADSQIAPELMSLIKECAECSELQDAKVFCHAMIADCSLYLQWNTEAAKPHGSIVGRALSESLKKYGRVDHSVWIEQDKNGEEKQ